MAERSEVRYRAASLARLSRPLASDWGQRETRRMGVPSDVHAAARCS